MYIFPGMCWESVKNRLFSEKSAAYVLFYRHTALVQKILDLKALHILLSNFLATYCYQCLSV